MITLLSLNEKVEFEDFTKELYSLRLVKSSTISNKRAVFIEVTIPNGLYLITPSTILPNLYGTFYINIKASCKTTEILIHNMGTKIKSMNTLTSRI